MTGNGAGNGAGDWAKAAQYGGQSELLRAATRADQRHYLADGLRPVSCARCANRVLVKKNSPMHTSIQWTTEAVAHCPEFARIVEQGGRTALIDSCPALRDSIDSAASEGGSPMLAGPQRSASGAEGSQHLQGDRDRAGNAVTGEEG